MELQPRSPVLLRILRRMSVVQQATLSAIIETMKSLIPTWADSSFPIFLQKTDPCPVYSPLRPLLLSLPSTIPAPCWARERVRRHRHRLPCWYSPSRVHENTRTVGWLDSSKLQRKRHTPGNIIHDSQLGVGIRMVSDAFLITNSAQESVY